MFYHSDVSFDYSLTGEIIGEKTVKKIEGSDLPWYDIPYKNAKIGDNPCGKVILKVFINFFVDQYNPDTSRKIMLKHIQSARKLDCNKLEKAIFIKEVYF